MFTASTSHLMYRAADSEFVAAVVAELATCGNVHCVDSLRIKTANRRDALGAESRHEYSKAFGAAYKKHIGRQP